MEVRIQVVFEVSQSTIIDDLINTQGFYLILGVQAGAFNRQETFKRERRARYCNKLNKTNMVSAKKSRELENSGISTPSIN